MGVLEIQPGPTLNPVITPDKQVRRCCFSQISPQTHPKHTSLEHTVYNIWGYIMEMFRHQVQAERACKDKLQQTVHHHLRIHFLHCVFWEKHFANISNYLFSVLIFCYFSLNSWIIWNKSAAMRASLAKHKYIHNCTVQRASSPLTCGTFTLSILFGTFEES